jgi:hypothetical protein
VPPSFPLVFQLGSGAQLRSQSRWLAQSRTL